MKRTDIEDGGDSEGDSFPRDRSMSVCRSVDTFTRIELRLTEGEREREREEGVTYDRGKGERASERARVWLVGRLWVVGWWGRSFDVGKDLFLIWCGSVICSCLE